MLTYLNGCNEIIWGTFYFGVFIRVQRPLEYNNIYDKKNQEKQIS